MNDLDERIAGHRRRGQLAPGWDASRWAALEPRVRWLDRALADAPARTRTVEGYLRVLTEALAEERGSPRHLLGRLLERLPEALVPLGDDAVAMLARCFNLADGLHEELPWLEAYAAASLERCADLGRLDNHLTEVVTRALDPGLALEEPPGPDVAWHVARVSLRPSLHDIVPGRLGLLAPRVLSVADREAPSRVCGLLVLGEGEVCPTGALRSTRLPRAAALPCEAALEPGGRVRLPSGASFVAEGLRELAGCLASPAGFVAVIAPDSQMVWVAQPAAFEVRAPES